MNMVREESPQGGPMPKPRRVLLDQNLTNALVGPNSSSAKRSKRPAERAFCLWS